MRFVGIIGEGIDRDTASGHEVTRYFEVLRIHQSDQILHDDIDAILVEVAMVAKREEVEFQAFALHHFFARDITNVEVSEIRLAGLRAQSGKLGTVECHQILVLGVFVGEGLQHAWIVLIRVLYVLISQQGYALQFVVCSHTLCGCEAVFSVIVFTKESGKTLALSANRVQRYKKICTYAKKTVLL